MKIDDRNLKQKERERSRIARGYQQLTAYIRVRSEHWIYIILKKAIYGTKNKLPILDSLITTTIASQILLFT